MLVNTHSLSRFPVTLTLSAALTAFNTSAALVVDVKFDGTLTNSGTSGGVASYDPGRTATMTYGGGVSPARATDQAFDNNAATMGGAVAGSTDRVSLSDHAALDNLSAFTLSCWFKTSASKLNGTGNSTLIDHLDNSSLRTGYALKGGANIGGNRQVFLRNTDGTTYQDFYLTVSNTTSDWVFVAFTYNTVNKEVKAYTTTATQFDALHASFFTSALAGTTTDQAGTFAIGALATDLRAGFDGSLDHVRLYNTALSQAEIQQLVIADVVPEPTSLALLAIGGLFYLRRRHHKRPSPLSLSLS